MTDMPTLRITDADVDENRVYRGRTDVSDYPGHIEIASGLGMVSFPRGIAAKGGICAEDGSGIEAGEGIEAGWGIEAGDGIKAGYGIKAGWDIEAGWDIQAGWGIKAGDGIKAALGINAGWDIQAGWGIKAGDGIKAGYGIKAGWDIEARLGIEAGLSISAETISSRLRIFAGLAIWRIPKPQEMEIRARLINGEIAYGTLVEPELTLREKIEAETDIEVLRSFARQAAKDNAMEQQE